MLRKLLSVALNPQRVLLAIWAKLGAGSFKLRLDYDVLPRPHYAYSVYYAAQLAERLGLKRISVLEFGVAGGNGLIELERMAEEVEKVFDVKIEIYGFDTGLGLPPPQGYRDLPYIWREGFFEMDKDALLRRLSRAKVVFGDVKDTLVDFNEKYDPAPVGAISFDLDYYSSTLDSMRIFDLPADKRLPRIYSYCDDVLSGEGGGILCDRVGQLAAIREYNEREQSKNFSPIHGFAQSRRVKASWNEKMYVHHDFAHELYGNYVHSDEDRQLSL